VRRVDGRVLPTLDGRVRDLHAWNVRVRELVRVEVPKPPQEDRDIASGDEGLEMKRVGPARARVR